MKDYINRINSGRSDSVLSRRCLQYLLESVPKGQLLYILEVFGGVGYFSRLLCEKSDIIKHHEIWEQSERCCVILRENFPSAKIQQVDSFRNATCMVAHPWDLISLDFSNWTLLKYSKHQKYRELTDKAFEQDSRFVQLTDSAVHKLHLHYFRYGINEPKREDYFKKVEETIRNKFNYGLISVAHHHNASYFLFELGSKQLQWENRQCKIKRQTS